MKRFLKNIFVFLFLFFVAEKAFYYFIINAPKKEYDKRLEHILDGKMNKDIIILGSSRGANNIDAKQIEDSTGLSTYNLSYRGCDILFQKFILETLLTYNSSPKYVLLTIDDSDEFMNVPTLNFRYDRLFPLKNHNYIKNKLIEDNRLNVLSKFFYSSLVKQKDFSLIPEPVLPINIMSSHGSKINSEKSATNLNYKSVYSTYLINSENKIKIAAYKAIEDLCITNHIKLVCVFPPNFKVINNDFYCRFKLLKSDKVTLLVYDKDDNRFKDSLYFRDESHLNKFGAKIFTQEITDFLKW